MAHLSQMNRYVSSWVGWTPAAAAKFKCCLSAKDEDDAPMPSSGFLTILALYLAITVSLAAVGFFCSSSKATDKASRLRHKRQVTQQQQQQHRQWRHSATGMALTKLVRQLGGPKRSRHQQRLRLRMRLRRHLELEQKLVRELQKEGPPLQALQGWQDAQDDLSPEAEQ